MSVNSALIIINLQNDFSNIIDNIVIKNIIQVIKNARNVKIPIYWIYSTYDQVTTDLVSDKTDILEGTYMKNNKICIRNIGF